MSNISDKVDHIIKSKQTRRHTCHWPGCIEQVAPAKWGCLSHWRRLPKYLRDKIWDSYEIGQEETLTPSTEYLKVAREVQAWIINNISPLER